MKYSPYSYQAFAEQFIIGHPAAGLLLDMGMGKTVITLSAVEKLMHDYFEIRKVLIIAPLLFIVLLSFIKFSYLYVNSENKAIELFSSGITFS